MASIRNVREVLSRDEIQLLCARSDAWGAWAVLSSWAIIGLTLGGLSVVAHPLAFALAVVVLGGRQLALAVLAHEAAHRTLFRHRALNDVLGRWLCAAPIGLDLERYRLTHMEHHRHTGCERDPDIELAPDSPMTRRSLARKLARDVLGLSGLKRLVSQFLMAAGALEYNLGRGATRTERRGRGLFDYAAAGIRHSAGFLLSNLALWAALYWSGIGWTYWAWAVAQLTSYSLFLRIRSLSEHACTERCVDPLRNTRTTRASLLARATVAPFRVNYHIEHHLLVAVPWYRLQRLHRLLRERLGVEPIPSYRAVLALVSAAPEPTSGK